MKNEKLPGWGVVDVVAVQSQFPVMDWQVSHGGIPLTKLSIIWSKLFSTKFIHLPKSHSLPNVIDSQIWNETKWFLDNKSNAILPLLQQP